LGEIFNYEQPTKYIVKSTEYDDTFNTPVLTAGKSFLLGYTDEITGIKNATVENPVVIFDDFTTGSHYVDFPFKIKSSAMKLLSLNDNSDNFYFMFNTLKNIKYIPQSHERHWISKFSEFEIYKPSQEEQQKIGSFFKQLDDTIALHQRKLDKLKQLKQGYLQQLFPKNDEKVPRVRFANFEYEWELHRWINTVDISTNMVDPKTGKYDELLHIGPGNIESFTGRILDNVNTVKNDNLISGKFHFNPYDIIYGKINPQLAKYAYVDFEGLASADAYVLNSKNGTNQGFLYVELQTYGFYKYSVSVSMRTGMPKINRDELNQFSYLAPKNIEEQQEIGTFFKKIDEITTLHQSKLDKLKSLKQSLLQKLFI